MMCSVPACAPLFADHVNSLLASGVQGLQQHCQDLQTIMNATFVSAQTHVANIIAALEQCK